MLPIQIRSELFWDIDKNSLDVQKNKRLIIDRVLQFGDLQEFILLVRFYGFDRIIGEIKNIAYLDPKTLEFVSGYFDINKEELKCFKQQYPF